MSLNSIVCLLLVAELEKRRLWRRQDYYRHREKRLATVKRRALIPEVKAKNAAYAKQYASDKKEVKREYYRVYRASHLEQRRAIGLAWAHRNKAKIKAWRDAHPELVRASTRKWARENRALANALVKRRRARLASCSTDSTAEKFYQFVRSRERIPCYYCGKVISGKKAHIDHVIAISKKGNHASENLCASCQTCNQRKGARLPSEISFVDQPLLNL